MADDSAEKPSKKRKASKPKQVRKKETKGTKSSSVEDVASFASFRLDARLLKALQNRFDRPTLVQAAAIPLALDGRDIVARAKTGSGKTLAYVVPILHQILVKLGENESKPIALVLVPSKELAQQVTQVFNFMTTYCEQLVKVINLTSGSEQVQKTQLSQFPEVIVSTPSCVLHHVTSSNLSLQSIQYVVIDEADLVLSYGHESDLQLISPKLSKTVQTYLMSATLTDEIHTLKTAMCRDPAILKLEEAEWETDTLTQYYVECAEDDKFLLIYVILKLKLLKGKCIVFVNDIDRCYRVKLYLEQFGIRSCVLNAELPLNSRLHIVEEFNKGVCDIILATEEANKLTQAASYDEAEVTDQESSTPKEPDAKEAPPSKKRKRKDSEFGVARGIDFQNVSFVINFDFATTSKAYLHRIGRTARAGAQGTSLSFIIPPAEYGKSKHSSLPSTKNDTKVLARVRTCLADAGRKEITHYQFDTKQLEAFRYRMTDALRAVTRSAVHQARAQELRKEILKSEKLKRHFEDNPGELDGLRHDEDTHVIRKQAHLKYIPEYLLPGGVQKGGKDLGFVGYRTEEGNRIRKARLQSSRKKKFGKGVKPKKRDPLKSFRPGK